MIETFFFKFSHQPQQEVEELKGKINTLRKQKESLEFAQQNGNAYSNDSDSDSQPPSPSLFQGTAPSFSDSFKEAAGENAVPQSPLRAHIRAFLPNNQRTMVGFFSYFGIFFFTHSIFKINSRLCILQRLVCQSFYKVRRFKSPHQAT